jgi:hypothetical protein
MRSRGSLKALWILAAVGIFVALFMSFLPAPIDIDLSKIGNGKQSVVFVYDPNLVVSNQQATLLNEAKPVIGENVNILIAKTGYPDTEALLVQYRAEAAHVLFIDGDGSLIEKQFAPVDAATIASIVNR